MRVAFVGQQTFFAACSLDRPTAGLEPAFLEFRRGADGARLRAELDALDPHVAVVFRPDIIPPGLFDGLRARTLGFLTEPLPRSDGGAAHEDLERRLWELREVDAGNFDRIVSFDPSIADSAGQADLEVWRSVPLPVADRYFGPVRARVGRPRVLFVGRGTQHREQMLAPVKHEFDLLHLAFGIDADDLEPLLREHDAGINLHNHPYPSFENRVSLYLAAGLLVLSEPLSPQHGLEPELDYLVCEHPHEILDALERFTRFPGIYDRVRHRGRRKAELFRASRVWPRVLADLELDVAAFGSPRVIQ
jgi:hypothetical protein